MASMLSIRERIEERLCQILAAIDGVGAVYRWDSRGTKLASGDIEVFVEAEQATEGGQGNVGYTDKNLTVSVGVLLRQDETDSQYSVYLQNKWLQRIEKAVMAQSPYLQEPDPSYEKIAEDVWVRETAAVRSEEGQREFWAIVIFGIRFRHDLGQPTKLGTLITEKSDDPLPQWATYNVAVP